MSPRLAECEVCPEVDDVTKPVYLADKNDCSKFYVCYSGKSIKKTCAEG